MDRERILITVRTYPTISTKYLETVCTGGITDAGEWRRLVPIPLRYLEAEKVFRTFDVIEVPVSPGEDGRPETRRPHLPSLRVIGNISDWPARWDWVKPTVFPSLRAMREQGNTLAPVAVAQVLRFAARAVEPEWSPAQKEKLRQAQLFDERKPLEKLPYEFRFVWRDEGGDEHDSLILAWELHQTYRQYRRRYRDPISAMRDKWLNDVCGCDRRVVFFMGNLASRRSVYCVCGVFNPPKEVADHATLW